MTVIDPNAPPPLDSSGAPAPSEGSSASQNPNSPPAGAPSPSEQELTVQAGRGTDEFSHELLKGKTPAEIEALVTAQAAAIRRQNGELNRLHSQVTQPAAPAPGTPNQPPKVEEVDYGNSFIAPQFRALEQRLEQKFKAMVEPLAHQARAGEGRTVRERLRTELRHFTTLEPHIDEILRTNGIAPDGADEAKLRIFYHTAVGLAAEQGVRLEASAPAPTAPSAPAPSPSAPNGGAPMTIPQNRPSAAPMAPSTPATAVRQLTEEERVLANMYFPINGTTIKTVEDQHAAYRNEQDRDPRAIVNPGFSREGW